MLLYAQSINTCVDVQFSNKIESFWEIRIFVKCSRSDKMCIDNN